MRRILWPIIVVVAGSLVGCATPQGAMTALDAAHRGLTANEQIVDAYQRAVMESFDQARGIHVVEAKHIVDRLAAEQKLTADVVKEGFDRFLVNLDAVEARRGKFQELYRLARQNTANAKEALLVANTLVAKSAATQQEIEGLLKESVESVRKGGGQ